MSNNFKHDGIEKLESIIDSVDKKNKNITKNTKKKTTVASVLGEILITGGILIIGYMIWQPLWGYYVIENNLKSESLSLSKTWETDEPVKPEEEIPEENTDIPIPEKVEPNSALGVMYVPSFGENYISTIGESVNLKQVLNNKNMGVGHYETTSYPGEPGNFAVAAHRSGLGPAPFKEIENLKINDPIFIETPNGWYIYRFKDLEYVLPDQIDVINSFPRSDSFSPEERIMTLTTCHPKASGSDERLISYAVFDSFSPRSEGKPAELVNLKPELKE